MIKRGLLLVNSKLNPVNLEVQIFRRFFGLPRVLRDCWQCMLKTTKGKEVFTDVTGSNQHEKTVEKFLLNPDYKINSDLGL